MIEVRKDLNEIVEKMALKLESSRRSERSICKVTLKYSGRVIDFLDKDNALYDLLKTYKDFGEDDVIKSRALIEDVKSSAVEGFGENDLSNSEKETFIAVLYELKNGRKFYLFPARGVDNAIIDLHYDKYKEEQKQTKNSIKEGKQG